jgi:RNA methyltransferase, TrmH family
MAGRRNASAFPMTRSVKRLVKAQITSTANPLAKQARALRHRKARADSGLFLIEGIRPVGEALEAGWELDVILYSEGVLESEFAATLIANPAAQLQAVSAEVMESLADKENPQGIVAIAHQRFTSLSDLPAARRGVAVVSPQDPGNVGTILRTVDAVGADVVLLLEGGVDPYHPTCVRASMGTLFWIPVVRTSFPEFVEWSQARSVQIIGTSAHAVLDYKAFKPAEPWMLLLGSEQKGLSAEHVAASDVVVSLPMRGRASSLNLAVAAGVLLYAFDH